METKQLKDAITAIAMDYPAGKSFTEDELNRLINSEPKNVNYWQDLVKFYAKKGDSRNVERIATEGIKALPEESISLWSALITYYTIPREIPEAGSRDFSKTKIEIIYSQGCNFHIESIADVLRMEYLHWLVSEKSLQDARNKFYEFSKKRKPSYNLIKTMIVLEERNIKPAVDVIQSLWELACSFYGEISEPWVNLVKHHVLQGRFSADYFKEQVELKVLGSNPNENKLKAEELIGQYKEAYRKLQDNMITTEITQYKSSSESSVEIIE